MAVQKAMVSSKSNEWATPQDFFDYLNDEFHFDLDVSANSTNAKCANYIDVNINGLTQDWHVLSKSACFMNPPYGGQTAHWIKKAWEESCKGAVVVCLIVSATDRSYWHDYIFPYAKEIRFIRGKLKFGAGKGAKAFGAGLSPFASAVIVFAGKVDRQEIIFDQDNDRKHNLRYNQRGFF
jgi:phage N-6-adenine-methyltransferase